MAYGFDHVDYPYMKVLNNKHRDVNQNRENVDDTIQQHQQQIEFHNSTIQAVQPSFTIQMIIVTLLCITVIIGVVGNAIVVYIFSIKAPSKKHASRRGFNSLLSLLGAVDLISSLVIPAIFIYLTLTNYHTWDCGYVGCKILPSLLPVSITITHGVLLMICYEQYKVVMEPFVPQTNLPSDNILTWLFGIVFLAVLMTIPQASTYDLTGGSFLYGFQACQPINGSETVQLVSALIYLCRDIFTIICMAYFFYKTSWKLTKHSSFSVKGRKVLKTVVFVFLLLTIPLDIFHVNALSFLIGGKSLTKESMSLTNTFLQILQISSSISNVFVYLGIQNNVQRFFCCAKTHPDGLRGHQVVTEKMNGGKIVVVIREDDMFNETDSSSCSSL
jgi:7 transmembrane receptor (rhodopsin family).